MALPDALASSRGLGRYFDVVTLLPSTVFVAYVSLLVATRPWTGDPDWLGAFRQAASTGLGGALLLAGASLLIGLTLHPLQFGMTQLLEGYWGSSRTGLRLMTHRVRHHRQRQLRLDDVKSSAGTALRDLDETARLGESAVEHHIARMESERLLQNYPSDPVLLMPTRLGNVLRRYEQESGAQYGLPAIVVAPHLALVAPGHHTAYVDGQRREMDLTVRMCWLSLAATVISVLLFWRTGWWLGIAAIPYAAAYVFYRGTLIMAAEYGTSVATLLDLNRFALYERMHLPPVLDTAAEFERNVQLRELFQGLPPDPPVAYTAVDAPAGDEPPHEDPTAVDPSQAP